MYRFLIAVGAIVLLVAAAGCGSGDLTLDQADPDAVPLDPSWDQVYAIVQRECVPCHTGDEGIEDDAFLYGTTGREAPAGAEPGLETCESIVEHLPHIVDRIFVQNDMPPGAWPRLSSEEKLIIQRWLDAGGEAPCN